MKTNSLSALRALFCCVFFFGIIGSGWGQNAIVGTGFSTGWGGSCSSTGTSGFKYLTAGQGTSYILTTTANGTGDQYWRFGIDWSGTTHQRTNTNGSDVTVTPNTKYTLSSSCTTSGSLKYNVPNTTDNYIFKTANAGSNPTGDWVFFRIQGAVRSISTFTQPTSPVVPGGTATVSVTLDGSLSTGQAVWLRYSATSNFSSSSCVQMTGSGTSYSASIPASSNTAGSTVYYYAFTSGDGASIAGSDADLFTINLMNNTGSNYSYTVASNFYSKSIGNLQILSNWGTSTDGSGTAPANFTSNGVTYNIRNNATPTIGASWTVSGTGSKIIVGDGTNVCNFTVPGTLIVTSPATEVSNNATITRTTSEANSWGTFIVNNGGKYVHDVNGGSVPTCTWSSGSTFEVTGITAATSFSSGGIQSFHHVVWNCPSQTSTFSFGGLTTINGNLTVQSTGASPSASSMLLLTNSSTLTTTVSGNVSITGGYFAPFGSGTSGNCILNISGNLSLASGTFDIFRQASNTGTINLSGDFSMTSGTLTKGGSGTGNFNFSKTGTQTYSKSGGTISNAINFTVNNGSILSLGSSVIDGSTGTFTLSSGAGLITSNNDGISTSGASGSIQVSGSRTYNTGANYTFNGSSAQSTGNGFTGANNLTINNAAGVTLTSSASLAGTLTLTSGTFTVGSGNTITVSNNGSITQSSGLLASGTGAGTFTFSGTGTVSGTIGFNNVNIAGGVNFGSASTINGTLTINSGGFVNTNAPIYASGSTLKYNSGGTYGRGSEWNATSGIGYPFHVDISNSTILVLGANNGTATARQIGGNLTVNSGSTLSMVTPGTPPTNPMTAALTVKGDYNNLGTTILSTSPGGDLILEGDLYDNATFTANGRAVFFHGSNIQEVNSTDDPLDIDVVRFNKTGGEVVLLQNLLIDETADPVQFAGTSILNLNGKTATFGKANTASTLTMNSSSSIKGNASSNLTILGNGNFGTIYFDQTTPGTTNQLGTLNINRANGSLTLGNAVTINGSLTLTSGKLNIGSNTLTLVGTVAAMSASNSLVGSATSNLTITGTGSLGTLFFDQTTTGTTNNINTFSLNRTSSGTINIANHLRVGSLSITAGEYVLNANQQLTVTGTLTNNGTLTLKDGATLVQGTSGTSITGSGTYNVEKQLTGNSSTWNTATNDGRFWYMGVPMSSVVRSGFGNYGASSNRVWSYNETTKQYTDITSDASLLSAGTGYVHRRSDNNVFTFTATGANGLYASDFSLTGMTRTAGASAGYHLISNPYMAYLDWEAVTSTNIEPTYFIRSFASGNINSLISCNRDNDQYTSTAGVTIDEYADVRYIAPLQAIWVRVTTAGTGTLNMTRSMLSHQSTNPGLKNTTVYPVLARVNLNNDQKYDQMLVFMNEFQANSVDNFDSEKMFMSGEASIYTMASGKKLVMNGLKNNKKKISVPLYLELPTSKVYQLQLSEYIMEQGLILLEDKQEGTMQDFTIHDTYAFYANSGVLSNRFVLHFFMPDATITAQGPSNSWVEDENEVNEGGSILVSSNGRGKVIIEQDIDPQAADGSQVIIRDASGRMVYEGQLEGTQTSLQLDAPSGVYFVEVQLNGQVEVKKIFVQQ